MTDSASSVLQLWVCYLCLVRSWLATLFWLEVWDGARGGGLSTLARCAAVCSHALERAGTEQV